jgi:hypothetical protein
MADAWPGTPTGKEIDPAAVHSDKTLILRIQTDSLKYERETDLANLHEQQEEERIHPNRRRVRSGVLLFVVLPIRSKPGAMCWFSKATPRKRARYHEALKYAPSWAELKKAAIGAPRVS